MASGEPYFYHCWAGLLFVTVPVAPQNKCCGGITVGGLHTAEETNDIAETVGRHLHAWPSTDLNAFLSRMNSLRSISPSALRGLGALVLETTFSAGLNSSPFFRAQNEKYVQQRRIAEAFEDMRHTSPSSPDVMSDTYRFLSFLCHNDRAGAMECMSQYLARLLMASNWDLTKLKAHIRVLLAVMTSQEILRGTPWAVATSRELRHMLRLEHACSVEESCYEVAEWIQRFFHGQDRVEHDGRSFEERVVGWLQSHYQERVTLGTAAKAVGASSSTLVHRLRRETGKTFKRLLTEIRIAEAKKLLASSALDISAIAEQCGFFDQSHFTRELKRAINLTPGEFRKLLRFPSEELQQPEPDGLSTPFGRRVRRADPHRQRKKASPRGGARPDISRPLANEQLTSPASSQGRLPTPHPPHSRAPQSHRRKPASPVRHRS
jgi:AraC-like DNA-binding protein